MTTFRTKRIYEDASADDGYRVLVDRLWPRGVSKERAALDDWCKEASPSTQLRKWFDHDPAKFTEFARRYRAELDDSPDAISAIAQWNRHSTVTLLYGAKDKENNEAVVLQRYCEH